MLSAIASLIKEIKLCLLGAIAKLTIAIANFSHECDCQPIKVIQSDFWSAIAKLSHERDLSIYLNPYSHPNS
ncbi:hypothetical protein [Nostoc cycadae]|uniref:hypothetical protein n=1 Tax=Nostoc cycadae TaxID=246795 RepID=UPI0011AF6F8B|nr:hypothetical protein [Nostoc cycadae]